MSRVQVSIYLDPKIHKILKHESTNKETTVKSLVEEAILFWVKCGKKLAKEEAEEEKKAAIQREIDEINEYLGMTLAQRKLARRARLKNG